ncbi:MAG: ribosome maturation factor RimP, partial [Candidatus Eiseniibacteriota bacterium]
PGAGPKHMEWNQLREDLVGRFETLLREESFDLWDLELASQSGVTVVRVYVDRQPGVSLQECAYWNKKFGRYLEAENLIRGRYVLEVGTPGIERALIRPEHYARFVGSSLEVKLHDPKDGRRTFRGELRVAGPDSIVISDPDIGTVSLPYVAIRKSHLIVDPWEGMRGQERRRKG